MEEHLTTVLNAAVAFPVRWGVLGHGTTLPRAVIFRVSGARDSTLDGPALMTGRVQIDCYGETHLEAVEASREIRAALEGYSGGPVQGVFLDVLRDGIEGEASPIYRVSMTFTLTYTEEPAA